MAASEQNLDIQFKEAALLDEACIAWWYTPAASMVLAFHYSANHSIAFTVYALQDSEVLFFVFRHAENMLMQPQRCWRRTSTAHSQQTFAAYSHVQFKSSAASDNRGHVLPDTLHSWKRESHRGHVHWAAACITNAKTNNCMLVLVEVSVLHYSLLTLSVDPPVGSKGQ